MIRNNTGAKSWRPIDQIKFDALPRRLKEIFWNAPYDFHSHIVVDMHAAGVAMARNRRLEIARIARETAGFIKRDWRAVDPNHPCIARFEKIAADFEARA